MNVTFVQNSGAFLPEIAAYQKYLSARGVQVDITSADGGGKVLDRGLCYRFGGLLTSRKWIRTAEIHEYHSASIGLGAKFKNRLKVQIAGTPVGRVFLSPFVRNQFDFPDRLPYMFRDMGVDEAFFDQRGRTYKKFDIVYAGSIAGRAGLLRCIERLATRGFRIGVAGRATDDQKQSMSRIPNVEFIGAIPLRDVPEFVGTGRMGLNYCPLQYPFIYQTSTKTLEYLAAGLPVISVDYPWMTEHSRLHGYTILPLQTLRPDSAIDQTAVLPLIQAKRFSWDCVLDAANFLGFLKGALSSA